MPAGDIAAGLRSRAETARGATETRTFAPPPELAADVNATADTYDDAAPDAPAFWARHFDI